MTPTLPAPTNSLYETDFYAWTHQQAALLREEALEQLDLPNLIEEIEAMGRRDRRELISRLTVLITHLLKWHFQAARRSPSWRNTMRTQRREIDLLLEDSPSLRRLLPECVEGAYPHARADAIAETRLAAPRFPPTCPYTLEQLLDGVFLPEA